MFPDPFHDLGVLVDGIVIDDDTDRLLLRHPGINNIQETNELLMAMTLHKRILNEGCHAA